MLSKPDSSIAKLDVRKSVILGTGAVAATSTMLFFGTGLHPIWWLTWLAPLPVLLLSPRVGALASFGIAALSWFLGSLNMWHYFLAFLDLPIGLVVIVSTVPACVFGLAVQLFRKFALQGALWKASLVFPTLWVAYEYLNAVTSPHSTFGNLGYTQMDNVPILQVVSLTGIWGISFCVFLLPATVAALLSKQASRIEKTRLVTVVGMFLAAVIVYGAWRLISTPAPEHSVKVGLMAKGVVDLFPEDDATTLRLLRAYLDEIRGLAAQDTQVIVLPEKIALASDQAAAQVDTLYAAAAAQVKASIVVGLDRGTRTRRSNEARLYSSEGTLAAVYTKHHLVPRFEDVDQPGTELTVLNEPSGVWGIEICKDMDFPPLSRQNGAKGVGLLLVPAWDFVVDGWLHGRMAIMRGVESGFTIARVAKQGRLTVSDDRGRILAEQSSETARFASLVASAPVRHDDTLYLLWGDWFAWANVVGLLLLIVVPSPDHSARFLLNLA